MMRVFLPIVFFLSFSIYFISCFDENNVDATDANISFSIDTLRFDTVFTTLGSVTRQFKIYNNHSESITLRSVRLAQGSNSKFRMNVDGISSNELSEIRILANDSIYVFVEVTIDPDDPLSVSPFIIYEELVIMTTDGMKKVVLEAWGQNANYFPSKSSAGSLIRLTCNNGTVQWDDPKPYVIYGLLFIDSCGLSIAPGTRIYVHGGLGRLEDGIFNDGGFLFMENGYINAKGTLDNPIVFQGDRLEKEYQDVEGQWAGIRLLPSSKGNILEHTIIQNSIIGVRADSASSLSMTSCIIKNTSNVGVIGINSEIQIDNSLIYGNNAQSVAFVSGGKYILRHCTLANYLNQAPAMYLDNFTCLNSDCSSVEVNPIEVNIENSIIMGSNNDELDITDYTGGMDANAFQLSISNSIIRVNELKSTIDLSSYCSNCIEYSDQALFKSEDEDDYHLESMSIALDAGNFINDLPIDLEGIPRDQNNPDLGCFEFIPQ
jgi:hypothetical protein